MKYPISRQVTRREERLRKEIEAQSELKKKIIATSINKIKLADKLKGTTHFRYKPAVSRNWKYPVPHQGKREMARRVASKI